MKKLFSLLLATLLLLSLCACGNNAPADSSIPADSTTVYEESGVTIDKQAFPADTVLKVAPVTISDDKASAIKKAAPTATTIVAYDITATANDLTVQPNGSVEVTFPIPAAYDSEKHDVAVYYIADDGTTEPVTTTMDGKSIVATLEHFSTYVVVLLPKAEVTTTTTVTTATTTTQSTTKTSPKSSTTTTIKPTTSKTTTIKLTTSKTTTAKLTTTTTTKPTTSKTTTAKPTTTTTTKPALPTDISGKVYELYKQNGNECSWMTFDFGKTSKGILTYGMVGAMHIDIMLQDMSQTEIDDFLANHKDEYFIYKDVTYVIGMGDSSELNISACEPGKVTLDNGYFTYTSDGNTITIRAVQGEPIAEYLKVGDELALMNA